jgi:hypothetical protein
VFKRILTLLSLVLCWACTEISFKEPQPKGVKELKEIPEKIRGHYFLEEDGSFLEDTIIIMANGYRIGFQDVNEKPEVRVLSDSLVVKQYKGYYFFSYRENVEWYLRIIQIQSNKDLLLLSLENLEAMTEDEKKKYLNSISNEVLLAINQVDESTYYVIDPKPKQLITLIKKGHFKKTVLKRINN